MTVRLNRFSDVTARPGARDRDVVTVTKRNELRLGGSRFRLVRWLVGSGIGKRLQNRRTVDAFVSSLRADFGGNVVDKMNLSHLDRLRSGGKPLEVRMVKAYLANAREVREHVDIHSRQQGAGALPADHAGRIQAKLTQFTGTENVEHPTYPDFFEGAVKDFGRARYIIGGEEMNNDEGRTVQAFTDLCRGEHGETDKKLLTVVQGLLFQRIFGLMLSECIGILRNENGELTTRGDSPFHGCAPVGINSESESRYSARKDAQTGKLQLEATHKIPAKLITHISNATSVPLDPEQSHYGMRLQVEVDPADYSATLTGADYEFQFTPQSQED